MLEVSLAKNLIEHLSDYTNYNINIMNEEGIIIASRDRNRIGTFHEVAYKLMRGDEDIAYTNSDKEFVGVLSGVNMILHVDGKAVGVLGITGKPEDVKPVALVVKMAVETLIKYESLKMQAFRRQTSKERFLYMLTEQEGADYKDISRLATELSYNEAIARIPIICTFSSNAQRDTAITVIKNTDLHSSEDISYVLDDNSIIIFKTLPKENTLATYKSVVEEYTKRAFASLNIKHHIYVGTIQKSFVQYHKAYKHALWLKKNVKAEEEPIYFYDYLSRYIIDTLPHDEVDSIFKIFDDSFDGNLKKNFVEIIDALVNTDFNLVKAAQKSFMHRNTFLYRYKKIQEALDKGNNSNDSKCIYIWINEYFKLNM